MGVEAPPFSSAPSGELPSEERKTMEGAEQNRMLVGCWKRYSMSAQLSLAIGMAMIRPQQIMHTRSMRGAITVTKASQKQMRPHECSVVETLMDSPVTDEHVAPYDLDGPSGTRCGPIKLVASFGMGTSIHEPLWVLPGRGSRVGVVIWMEGPRGSESSSCLSSRKRDGLRMVSLSEPLWGCDALS